MAPAARDEQAEPSRERTSQPGARSYGESSERVDETTQRRSAPVDIETSAPSETQLEAPLPSSPASNPYLEEEEGPTGVRPMSGALVESDGPPSSTGFEQPEDDQTIVEALPPLSDEAIVMPPSSASPSSLADVAPESEMPAMGEPESIPREAIASESLVPAATAPASSPAAATDEAGEAAPVVQRDELDIADSPSPKPSDADSAIAGIVLSEVRGLEDLPPETQTELIAKARVEKLGPEEEVSAFGLALVLQGRVAVMPAIADVACAYAGPHDPVFCKGNLAEGVEMRVVAGNDGATVAVWRADDFEGAMQSCPWVAEELRNVADRFQALAGATMGPLGESLDEMMRSMVTDRAEVKLLEAGEVLVEKGKPLPGLHIVGAGRLELEGGSEKLPGDLLFAQQMLSGGSTPATVRAGEQGALVLFVDRMVTHELMMSVPPLLEMLATA